MNSFMCVSMLAFVCGLGALYLSDAAAAFDTQLGSCAADSGLKLADKNDETLMKQALAELDKPENSKMKAVYMTHQAEATDGRDRLARQTNRCPSTIKYLVPPPNCIYIWGVTKTVCSMDVCQDTCCNTTCDYWYRCRKDHYTIKWTIKICFLPFPPQVTIELVYFCVPTQCNCYRKDCAGWQDLFTMPCC